MLLKKMFREIKKDWLRYLIVFIMIFVCLFIFSGLQHAQKQMRITSEVYLSESKFASGVLQTTQLTKAQQNQLEQLSEIKKVIPRFWLTTTMEQRGTEADLTLVSFSEEKVNLPIVLEGEELHDGQSGLWLNQDFMEKNQLAIGEVVSFQLDRQRISLPILGSIKQPEFLYYLTSLEDPLPDLVHHAYAFISEEQLRSFFPPLQPNQAIIDLNKPEEENREWLEQDFTSVFGEQPFTWQFSKDLVSIKNFADKIEQIQKLSLIFPVLFFILVFITLYGSMKRLVVEQTEQIGVLESVGIPRWQIRLYYISIAFTLSFVGSALGLVLGKIFLTPYVLNLMETQYSIIPWQSVFSIQSLIAAALLVVLCTLIPLITVNQQLRLQPAQLFRLKNGFSLKRQNTGGSRNGERFFSESWRWTFRDIQRAKGRSLMGIFGAFGCVVLLIAGLGINDTVRSPFTETFHQTYDYQEKIIFQQGDQKVNQAVLQEIDSPVQWEQQMKARFVQTRIQPELSVFIYEGNQGALIHLKNQDGKELFVDKLKRNEVIMSRQTARRLGINQGDSMVIRLSGENNYLNVRVNHLSENSAPQGIFLSATVWENLGQTFHPMSVYIADSLSNQQLQEIKKSANVSQVKSKSELEENTDELLKSVNGIILILVFAAILLGVTILANTFLLIFSERYREFATLKVLGFSYREMFRLLLQENIFLLVIGIMLGVPGGLFFLDNYARIVSLENQAYQPHISLVTWLVIFGIFLVVVTSIQSLLYFKIHRIDMLSALKSNE